MSQRELDRRCHSSIGRRAQIERYAETGRRVVFVRPGSREKRLSLGRLTGLISLVGVMTLAAMLPALAATVRQPYLQQGTPTSMTLVWRTDTASDSRVHYGTVQGTLNLTATNAASVTNHIVTITGLSPATRYYYDVGSTTTVQEGGTAQHFFVTSPVANSTGAFRAWVLGDSGDGGGAQLAVRNAMLTFTSSQPPDIFLHLGDIAYTAGTEDEFTNNHFNVYKDIMRHTVLWPTLGNHEGASTTSGSPGASSGPYYDAFVLPTAAEAGGAASGTEAYYSYDYANVHFISLNSYQVSRAANGPMANWLVSDLAATNKQWVVAYWHHPPYTHGTHNSDSETELIQMRENILPILEAGGVDLVLTGHSHNYERSYLIDGVYSTPTPNFATLESQGHILDDGNGKPSGTGAYLKSPGQTAHQGAVYVVAGHGGAGTGGSLNHPVMYFSELSNGSCLLDVSGNTLSLTNLRSSGQVSDNFSIVKGNLPPRLASTNPAKSSVLSSLTSVQVTFSTAVTGVDAADLIVSGSPATGVSCPSCSGGAGAGPYTFTGFPAPGNGTVSVTMSTGGIADASDGSLMFAGDSWTYTIDTTPPRVLDENPARNHEYGVLPSITINFTKPVTGVVASNLTVNGSAATQLSGISGSSGPYTFTGFANPPVGQISVTLAAGAIQDTQAVPLHFAGDSWTYVIRPHLLINEFLASNNTAAMDEFGEHDDFLEIYNPAQTAVDMSGMYLTDTLSFPAQYEIPAGVSIPAGGHLVFWCDSQPGQGARHTNFNLLRSPGEQIGLFDTEENGFAQIDALTYSSQTTDVANGRFPDGATTGFVGMPVTAGAVNTISCTTSGQCSALADTCNTGACVNNRCVAQFANQGGACNDGIACRGPDTCNNGVCDGGATTCTSPQTCNLVSGLCETPPAQPLSIPVGSTWKYLKGTAEPSASWNTAAFDDATWLSGASGFGYGTDCTVQRGTTLSDMLNGYFSIYMRHTFEVTNPALVTSLTLTADYDDAFVAYVNGTEVARSSSMGGTVGTPPAFNTPAGTSRECSTCDGTCVPADTFNLSLLPLVSGTNVIAIHAHNQTINSSDFTIIPSVSGTLQQGCQTDVECNDNNPCTSDLCNFNTGTCTHANNDANVCSDAIACTTDACSGGTCVSTSNCGGALSCNHSNGVCESAPITVTFQQGVSAYSGGVDTFVNSGAATTSNAGATPLVVDGDPTIEQVLLRFNGIFGGGAGQVPLGASIQSATLTLNITNASADGASFHRMLSSWSDTDTYNTFGGNGIQADDVEAVSATDVSTLFNGTVPALFPVTVTNSVAAWSAGATNLGWVLLPNGTDSWQFSSDEDGSASLRPKLSVTYTFTPPCSVDADCSDNNVCNGIETCVSTVCTPGTALNCDDANVCTTDTCNAVTGCGHANNAAACSDGNACTTGDVCSGGSCQSGSAANCDDSNVCTTDSCDTGLGCQHTNNALSCNDGNLCTTADACAGGTCSGTAVSCPGGSTCSPASGQCVAAPVTVSFQDGAGGYGSTQDTYLDESAPTTARGALDTWRWDTEDPAPSHEFGLVRFDNMFGPGAGQIPVGATITSATLTLVVFNGGTAPAGAINDSAIDWSEATTTWNNFGSAAGVQAGDIVASPNYAAPLPISTATVDVTPSVQAWSSNTRPNYGWIVSPDNLDGVQVRSAEYLATPTERPKLTVVYTAPAATCSVPADCNDNNVCTNDDCVAGSCSHVNNTSACNDNSACTTGDACSGGNCTGTTVVCNDSNVCTTDSCVPATGCVFTNNTASCSDGNACTTGDVCSGGSCQPGGATNCDDSNVCTTDSCVPASGCAHANNTNSCSDGSLCTTGDVCVGGTCSGTPVSCSGGQTCNPANGQCESNVAPPLPIVVGDTWRYFKGTVEPAPPPSPPTWAAIAFDDTSWLSGPSGFGYGPDPCMSQVGTVLSDMINPPNSPGYFSIYVRRKFNIVNPAAVSAMSAIIDYDDSVVLYVNGTEVERSASMGGTAGTPTAFSTPAASGHECSDCDAPPCNAAQSFTISPSLLVAGTNVIAIHAHNITLNSSDFILIPTVSATISGCTTNADCNDNNVCNGTETCVSNVCQAGTALNCDDSNVCTTDSCVPASGCAHANNTVSCSDGNACTTGDVCSGGSCQPGGATNCDDSNVCTTDSCVAPSGCVHANNTLSCSDGNLCTTGDVCGGGTCSGTAVSCPVGQSCVPATGICTSGPVTASFQQGVSGYLGTVDTYIDTALGSQATVTPIVADGSPEEQILVRFDGIFGSGPTQIPAGSTINTAMLTLHVGTGVNDPSPNAVNFHRLLHDWSDAGLWAAYGASPWNTDGGIQPDGTDAMAVEVSTTMTAADTSYSVSVLPSLQAWSANPSNNHGWAILDTGTDGLRVESSEVGNSAKRPLLTVTYTPPAPTCTVDADCNDNNVCTTDTCAAGTCNHTNNAVSCSDGSACTTNDACSGGICVGGPAPNCNDGNVCTTDSCIPASGCAHANNTVSCDDGNVCTTGDVCGGGACGGTPVSCPAGQACNSGTGLCETQGRMNCALSSPFVAANGTVGMTVLLQNLGNLAGIRGYQTQIAITRTSGSGTLDVACPGGVSINESRPDYIFTGQSNTFPVMNCPLKRASSSLLTGSVTVDGTPDYMSSYTLTASSTPGSTFDIAISPSPGSALANASGQSVAFAVSAPCTVTVTGGCTTNAECDDSNPCTNDSCVSTSCVHTNNTNPCEDGSACTTGDTCSAGICVGGPAPNCNDGNDCTTDGCNPGSGCTHANNTNSCNDGSACTTNDACSGGICVGGPAPNCDDGNVCTTDGCIPASGCTHINNSIPCEDGSACTTGDTCAGGSCVGGPAPSCDDGNVCTTDGCNPGSGCTHANNTNSCNDGSACTTNDTCSGGSCVGGAAPNCNDGNDCTTDGCNPGSGCTHVNNANPCDDGSACTTNDACSGGSCVGGPATNCDDGSICTTDGCNPASGCTHVVSGLCSISGNVRYYRNNASGGSEPSVKPVPNVDIDDTQDTLADATTDSGGAYGLGSQAGNVTVRTLNKYGPRPSDERDAVSSFDASVIAQFAAHAIPLSNNQQIAGDVTGNGSVTSFDASFVAQFAVQIIDHFDVATNTGSDWRYLRCDTYTSSTNQTCTTPNYSHAPLLQTETDNFYAVLYGDVTGNWTPATAFASSNDGEGVTSPEELAAIQLDREQVVALRAPEVPAEARSASAGPATLSLAGWSGPLAKGERRDVLVRVDQADGIQAMDLVLGYDPKLVSIVGIRAVDVGSPLNVVTHDDGRTVSIAAYGVLPLRGSGAVLSVTVEAREPMGRKVPLRVRGEANEGGIPLVTAGQGSAPAAAGTKKPQPSRSGR